MTLIVGYANNGDGYLIADSALTWLDSNLIHSENIPWLRNYGLKLHILTPRLAVCTAGIFNLGVKCIAKLATHIPDISDPNETPEILAGIYRQICTTEGFAIDSCDFLILVVDAGRSNLHCIKSAVVSTGKRFYIGDSEAYRVFRRYYSGFESECPPEFPDLTALSIDTQVSAEFLRETEAMRLLVADQKILGVGAIANSPTRVRKGWPSTKLEYMQEALLSSSEAERNGGYTILASTEPYAMAIYFPAGNVGFLFRCGSSDPPSRIPAATAEHFIQVCNVEYSVSLLGPLFE